MELVIDANVLISALISSSGKTSEILFSDKIKAYAPEYLFEELGKHKKEISEKSGLSIEDIDVIISLFSLVLEIVPFDDFKDFIKEAFAICPDHNDTEYFALALKLKCPLWSNDKKLKQGSLKVLTTSELLKIL